jgi:hypothetical protein
MREKPKTASSEDRGLFLSRNKILTDISPSLDARLEGQRVGFLFWALPAVETARQRRFYVSEFQAARRCIAALSGAALPRLWNEIVPGGLPSPSF